MTARRERSGHFHTQSVQRVPVDFMELAGFCSPPRLHAVLTAPGWELTPTWQLGTSQTVFRLRCSSSKLADLPNRCGFGCSRHTFGRWMKFEFSRPDVMEFNCSLRGLRGLQLPAATPSAAFINPCVSSEAISLTLAWILASQLIADL